MPVDTSSERLQYPVLAISPSGDMWFYADSEDLHTSNTYALRHRMLDDLLLIEPSGSACRVREAKKVGPAGPLGGSRCGGWGWSSASVELSRQATLARSWQGALKISRPAFSMEVASPRLTVLVGAYRPALFGRKRECRMPTPASPAIS
jgi:hypothetical protein